MIDAGLVWPADGAGAAMRALAGAVGTGTAGAAAPDLSTDGIPGAAIALGLEAEPRDLGGGRTTRDDLRQALEQGPLLIRLPAGDFAALLRARHRHATLVGPSGLARVPLDTIEDALWAAVDGDQAHAVGPLRDRLAAVLPGRRALEAARLLAPRPQALAEAWVLRPRAPTLRGELDRRHVAPRAAAIALAYVAEMLVFVGIWRHVGAEALAGRTSGATLFALLALWAALQLGAGTAVRRLALDVGAVIRVWLLRGAVRLDPEAIRDAGVGQLLGRALDAEALDTLALGSGVEALAGLFEVGFAAMVLAMGLGPATMLGVLALAAIGLGLLARALARRHAAWSQDRRALTHELVERMVGHRTLLAQDHPDRRSIEDERALGAYEAGTLRLDRVAIWSEIGLPRSFLLLGLAAIGASLIGAPIASVSMAAVAASLGGAWLAYSGLRRLGAALGDLIAARDAWARVRPLVGAPDEPSATNAAPPPDVDAPIVTAQDVGYRYPRRQRPQLDGVSLALAAGERWLVAGPSGAGKSTLGALLTGLKVPTTGRLLFRGVDQRALGLARWRRAVGAVPQFHENHVFGADLLFNLLMGRRWPPRPADLALAETVCRELGLGPLLARMPAGLQQVVGETGWQLSHGERSRLYVARSLLQALDARVLDESFAALDPETLDEVMAAVLRRPEALVVIAHP